MPTYEVKCWLIVEADDEEDAERKAEDALSRIPTAVGIAWSVEGEGSTYRTDAEEEDE